MLAVELELVGRRRLRRRYGEHPIKYEKYEMIVKLWLGMDMVDQRMM